MDKTLEDYAQEIIYERMCVCCPRLKFCHKEYETCDDYEQAKEDMINEYHR